MKKLLLFLMFTSLLLCFSGCNTEDAECNNPEVTAFVKQLKAGTYNTKNELGIVVLPPFTVEDIPDLLKHAENLAVIPSFPTMYNSNSGKTRLGECLLWLIESIRLGMPT